MALARWQLNFLADLKATGDEPPWQLIDIIGHNSPVLLKLPAGWEYPKGFIRRVTEDECWECPAVAIANNKHHIKLETGDFTTIRDRLGLDEEQFRVVIRTADHRTKAPEFDPEFRAAMLEAVGLAE